MKGGALARARAAIQLRRHEEAAREAGLAVADDPEDPDGYYLLALALFYLARHVDALAAVDSGLTKAPGAHALHLLRADVLRGMGRPRDALAAAQEAVRLDPHDADCHAGVALAYAALGNHSEAILALRRALELAPHSAKFHRWLGDECLALTDHPGAITHYHHALSLEPNDANTFNNLGCALARDGRSEEAALAFKAAVLLDPTLKVAKVNAHDTLRGIVSGASVFGVLALAAVKLKLFWVLFLVRSWLIIPWVLLVFAAGVVAWVAVAKVRGVRRMRRLAHKDPQLLALYQRLKVDKKTGRL